MATWPVRVTARSETLNQPRIPIRFGGEVLAAPVVEHDDREQIVVGMVVVCPRCGSANEYVTRSAYGMGGGFSFEPETPHAGDVLTVDPSITCSCCGAYRLTSGVLRDI